MSNIHINKDGSIKGIPKDIERIRNNTDYTIKSTHNQTSCSGNNSGSCSNASDCSGSTNFDSCSNSGSCAALL